MKTTLVIQAGGQSSRMGRNKALVPFLGQPLIQRVIQRLQPLAAEVIITSNQPQELAFLGLLAFPDLVPNQGALEGLRTALYHASTPAVAVVATDMPFPSLALLQKQVELLEAEGVDVVIPAAGDGFEPFHAVYRRETCLSAIEQAIESGQKRMISWFPEVKVRTLTLEEVNLFADSRLVFLNINTPEELAQAEKLAEAESA